MKLSKNLNAVAVATALAVGGIPSTRASLCDDACQAGGVIAAVNCKVAATIVAGYATAAVSEAYVEIGYATAVVWSLCDDYGVYWYNECTTSMCGC